MALYKSGDPIIDEYNSYPAEQLIQIVTDTRGRYLPGVVEAARSILLGRGYDYRTPAQKTGQNMPPAAPARPRVRPDQSIKANRPLIGSAIKGWYWIYLVFVLVRMAACLIKHS